MKERRTYDLKERIFKFAQRILDICAMLPRSPECDIIRRQLIKAGTSVGANTEEADGTLTKPDFVNKLTTVRKEVKETKFWLRLISGRYIKPEIIEDNIKECSELINIFSSISKKTK